MIDAGAPDEQTSTIDGLPRRENVERTLRPEEVLETLQAPAAQSSLPCVYAGENGALAGDFELNARLGEGGMGEVFLAYQRSLRRQVALKRVKSAGGAESQALVHEARTAGGLEHPNVVPVHVLGTDEAGRALLVMKRVEGVSLQTLAKDPSHSGWSDLEQRYGDRVTAIIEVACRVSDALEFAHDRGVIHRDVKPENVMVGRHGEVYLLDWGVALDKSRVDDEGPWHIVGTPAYMAPEMVLGDPSRIDARTDVYLLAATIHAVLTGRPRHVGSTIHEALALAAMSAPVVYGPEIEPELAGLCNRGTSPSPDDRPQDAARFREELRRFLRQRSALARARRIEARLAEVGASAERGPAPEVVKRREVIALLGEAKVVLDEARVEIGEHPALSRVRRALALASFELEIERQDADAADVIDRELSPTEPTLAARVAALRARLAEAAALEQAARAERHESDPRHASAALGVLTLAVFLVPIVVSQLGSTRIRSDGLRWLAAEIDMVVLGAMVLTIAIGRRTFLVNRYGRSATLVIFAIVSSGTFAELLAAAQRRSAEQGAPFTLAALAGPLVAGGSFFGWPMVLCGLVTGMAAALCLVVPSAAPTIVAVTELFAVTTTIALLLRAVRRPLEATDPVAKQDSHANAAPVSREAPPSA
jgi:hypothetical protein